MVQSVFFKGGIIVLFCAALAVSLYYMPESATLTEYEARTIAEGSCIKGGEALKVGFFDETIEKWMFVANLNATREKCIAVCAVNAKTKQAAIEWSCEQ